MQAGSRGHDVIQNCDMFAAQINSAAEGATNAFCPLFPWQSDLGRGGAYAFCALGEKRQIKPGGHEFRQFKCLIEAPFPQAGRMQRHGDE